MSRSGSGNQIPIKDFRIEQYRKWLDENATLTDPFSVPALRRITYNLLLGRNYRLLTEDNTKGRLFTTFLWLCDLQRRCRSKFGAEWLTRLFEDIQSRKAKPPELANLSYWLMGLTRKTATNLGITKSDYPQVFQETLEYFNGLFSRIRRRKFRDEAWLLMMAGSATLNIRGSQKSKVGKQLEKVFLRALLSILDLRENETFWMNLERDAEVDREADGEVQTRRGRIRIDVALIASGNQEVIEDKIARVGRNGIVLFDMVGARSRVYATAEGQGVKLIQIRNGDPLRAVYQHLQPITGIDLAVPPSTPEAIEASVQALPDNLFLVPYSERR